MKTVIILSLVAGIFASLEPPGYRVPGSGAQSDHYLPPERIGSSPLQTPESHYLPTNYRSPAENAIPNSQYLPSNHGPASPHGPVVVAMPSAQYLPTHHQPHSSASQTTSSRHHVEAGQRAPSPSLSLPIPVLHTSSPADSVTSRYLPPSQRPDTFTQAIPSSSYLPSDQNQYPKEISKPLATALPPSNTYLTPNKFTGSLSGFSSQSANQYGGYSGAKSMEKYYPASGYPGGFEGYGSEDAPVKYEFEYNVKDDFGNDYGHKETRNGDNTQGVYTVLLPDGRKQIVRYTANKDGYKPTITYEETASGQSGYNQGYQY